MARDADWHTLKAPVRLTETSRSKLSSVTSRSPCQSATPAFEQTMSSGPSSDSTAVTISSTAARSETSAVEEGGSAAEPPELGDELGCLVLRLRRR